MEAFLYLWSLEKRCDLPAARADWEAAEVDEKYVVKDYMGGGEGSQYNPKMGHYTISSINLEKWA